MKTCIKWLSRFNDPDQQERLSVVLAMVVVTIIGLAVFLAIKWHLTGCLQMGC
jgi:hypothetical protein